ncbi:uridine kinase [bacterium]|nr:MAG: uridine kinase [bacterium]
MSKKLEGPLVIGVAGGSGSGKTTVMRHMIKRIGEENLTLVDHDAYYRDLKHIPFEERTKQNFDHPSALETELMIRHIEALKNGYSVDIPIYDFVNHIRSEKVRSVSPRQVILVDGILIFYEKELRDLMHIKVFVDTDSDIRLLRRLTRDICERGRTLESVLHQYENNVRPMHLKFVEPTKRYADIIIPHGGENLVALDMVDALISKRLKK